MEPQYKVTVNAFKAPAKKRPHTRKIEVANDNDQFKQPGEVSRRKLKE